MVENKGLPGYQGRLNDRCVTMAEVLGAAGYFTAMSGKWHVGQNQGVVPWERGFQRYINAPAGGFYYGAGARAQLFLNGKGLAPMTVRKRLQFATMIFRAALRRRLVAENPFADVSIKASMPNRERFVTPEEAAKLLDACPNHHWRAIVALARYGGLRCPSEVLSLRWQDIDWEAGRIVVTSPKTEHHPGKTTRTIPLFAELRPILSEAFDLAPEGAVYVVGGNYRDAANTASGWRNCNLRTQFERIVKRAGLQPWPRLFHNLRSSRQTELAERFPSHVVCDWLGNSDDIARKHYYQTTAEHFFQATRGQVESGAQNGAQAAQNAAQRGRAEHGGESHKQGATPEPCAVSAIPCETQLFGTKGLSGWGGIRTYQENAEKMSILAESGAECGAHDAQDARNDPRLGEILDAWPHLLNAIKAGILAMVRTAGGAK